MREAACQLNRFRVITKPLAAKNVLDVLTRYLSEPEDAGRGLRPGSGSVLGS